MLKICLVFWKSEPQYAYKRYAYKRKNMYSKTLFSTALLTLRFKTRRSVLHCFLQSDQKTSLKCQDMKHQIV